MIDKIIDLKDNMPIDFYNEVLKKAIETKDARLLFLMAYFVKDADKVLLGEEILKFLRSLLIILLCWYSLYGTILHY